MRQLNKNGFTILEALLAVAILMMLMIGGLGASRVATAGTVINRQRSQANVLASEAMEALLSTRANDFNSLSEGDFHPFFDGSKWIMVPGPETIDGFTRVITLSSVYRGLGCTTPICDIVSEGGITDEGSLMASVRVSWTSERENREIHLSTLISYWR